MSLTAKVRTLRQLSWAQRGLLLEAFLWLGLARGLLLTIPFKRIVPHLELAAKNASPFAGDARAELACEVGRATRAASRNTPWQSACLVQAMTAKMMLKRRGVPSTLYLGLRKEDGELEAHAWLCVDDYVVTGGPTHVHFQPISAFGEALE